MQHSSQKRLDAILAVCETVRADIEKLAALEELHVDHLTMKGMCARASFKIHTMLKQAHGISSTFVMVELKTADHVFLTSGPYLIDITATQFVGTMQPMYPHINVLHIRNDERVKEPFWLGSSEQHTYRAKTVATLVNWVKDWPLEQRRGIQHE